jgi:hypothetical protein
MEDRSRPQFTKKLVAPIKAAGKIRQSGRVELGAVVGCRRDAVGPPGTTEGGVGFRCVAARFSDGAA